MIKNFCFGLVHKKVIKDNLSCGYITLSLKEFVGKSVYFLIKKLTFW